MTPEEQKNILKVIKSPNLGKRSKLGWLIIPVLLLPIVFDAFKQSDKTLILLDLNYHINSSLPY
tara:strand:+ start:159 stop:350 length:192 start_codon:yes stop_codon:yes gene_type:complete